MRKDTQPKKDVCVRECQLMSESKRNVQLEKFKKIF